MTTSQSLEGSPVHPYDIPDTAHPPMPEGPEPNPPLVAVHHIDVAPEWINAEALHAAVATAQMEVTGESVVWGSEEIMDLARIYREFIKGER